MDDNGVQKWSGRRVVRSIVAWTGEGCLGGDIGLYISLRHDCDGPQHGKPLDGMLNPLLVDVLPYGSLGPWHEVAEWERSVCARKIRKGKGYRPPSIQSRLDRAPRPLRGRTSLLESRCECPLFSMGGDASRAS
jgi:hypothetical protein